MRSDSENDGGRGETHLAPLPHIFRSTARLDRSLQSGSCKRAVTSVEQGYPPRSDGNVEKETDDHEEEECHDELISRRVALCAHHQGPPLSPGSSSLKHRASTSPSVPVPTSVSNSGTSASIAKRHQPC